MLTAILTASFSILTPLQHTRSEGAAIYLSAAQRDDSATAEDVEILRRLLVEAINATREKRTAWRVNAPTVVDTNLTFGQVLPFTGALSSFYSLGGGVLGRPVTHSRGFHVPGTGALYCIDAQLPVVQVESEEEPEAEEEQADDDWERIRRQVRIGRAEGSDEGEGTAFAFTYALVAKPERHFAIDPDAIDRVERAVLRTLARHGTRVQGLRGNECITVALHLQPVSHTSAAYIQPDDADEPGQTVWSLVGASQARAVSLVIQVSCDDIERLAPNGSGLKELRRRALVHRY